MSSRFCHVIPLLILLAYTSQSSVANPKEVDLATLVKAVKPSVVTVLVYEDDDEKPDTQGTGWFSDQILIVTNFHVVRNAKRVEVKLSDGRIVQIEGYVADNPDQDLILLQVKRPLSADGKPAKLPPPLPMADAPPDEGTKVFIVGTPLGLEQTVSDGIVSSVRELPGMGSIIQTTASISSGSSGSPILSMDGRVIGVASFQIVNGQSLNFGIAISSVAQLESGLFSHPLNELANRELILLATDDVLLAWKLHSASQPLLAILMLDSAIKKNPRNWLAYGIKGEYLAQINRYQDAVDCYKLSLQINPNIPVIHNKLGIAYAGLGRNQDAIKCYEMAIKIKADYAFAYYNSGLSNINLNQLRDAINCFKHAASIKPKYHQAFYMMGLAYGSLEQIPEALDCFKHAINIKPDYAEAHFSLGGTYTFLGDRNAALLEYKTLKELDLPMAEKLFKLINEH